MTDQPKRLVTFVDPPSGWRYGFPKEMPDPRPEDMDAWLISQGYPDWLIKEGMSKYVRCWDELVSYPLKTS